MPLAGVAICCPCLFFRIILAYFIFANPYLERARVCRNIAQNRHYKGGTTAKLISSLSIPGACLWIIFGYESYYDLKLFVPMLLNLADKLSWLCINGLPSLALL